MIFKILGFAVVVLLLLCIGISIGLVRFVTMPKRTTMEENILWQKEHGVWGDYERYDKEELNVKSYDGYLLHGVLLKNPGKKFVIVTHGYTDNRYGCVKYAHIYYRLGYNVYIYDLRHFGENKKVYCSMGYKEPRDILAITEFLYEKYGKDILIGLQGESLGCASSVLALGQRKDYAFCVADCGFSDLKELLVYQAKKMLHLPPVFAAMANVMCKIMHGYFFFDVRPIDTFLTNETPVLFMHGGDDDYVPTHMSRDMYKACSSPKEIHIFEGAAHARSYISAPEQYEAIVTEFLKKNHIERSL